MAARIDGKQSFVHPHVYTQKQKQHQHSNYNSTNEQQWSYCSEWNSSTSLWVQVVTWPPSPWRLNEDRFKRESLLIYRGLNSNGWLEMLQGRGWFMQTLVPGVTPLPPLWPRPVATGPLNNRSSEKDWHLALVSGREREGEVGIHSHTIVNHAAHNREVDECNLLPLLDQF